jgi:hypothetical protein
MRPKYNSATTLDSTNLVHTFIDDVLTITGAIPAELDKETTISFSLDILNPISTATKTGFEISTTDSVGGIIDTAANSMRVTVPAQIYGTKLQARTTTEVQEK